MNFYKKSEIPGHLYQYFESAEIGHEQTIQEYIDELINLFDNLYSKLKDSGTLWVNISDTYYNGPRKAGNKVFGNPEFNINRTSRELTKTPKSPTINYKKSCACLVPERFAIGMVDNGWILKNKIIWEKTNAIPESMSTRFARKYEVIYFFTKTNKYYFDLDSVRIPHKIESIKRAMRGVSPTNKYAEGSERPGGVHANTMSKGRDYVGYQNMEERVANGETVLNPKGKNPGDIWAIPTKSYRGAHFATFNTDLISKPIIAGCPEDGWVLDPFAGSGTTGKFCKDNNRNCILFELNPEYETLIRERIAS